MSYFHKGHKFLSTCLKGKGSATRSSYLCSVKEMFRQIGIGIVAYYRSFEFIVRQAMWLYFLIPGILSILIYWGGEVTLQKLRLVDFKGITDDELDRYLILGLQALFVFAANKMNKYVVMILLSPVLTQLSARTERILSGHTYPFGFRQYVHNLLRGLQIAFRNLFFQMIIVMLWLVIAAFVPGADVATPVVVFFIGFYFYGFYFMDYVSERLGYNLQESVNFIRKNAAFAFTIGGIFSLLFLIPYAGVVVAPISASIAATIGVDKVVGLRNSIRGRVEGGKVKKGDPRDSGSDFSA